MRQFVFTVQIKTISSVNYPAVESKFSSIVFNMTFSHDLCIVCQKDNKLKVMEVNNEVKTRMKLKNFRDTTDRWGEIFQFAPPKFFSWHKDC